VVGRATRTQINLIRARRPVISKEPRAEQNGGYLRLRAMDDRARRQPGFLDRGRGYGLPVMMRS
jgi:hypothetical protein